MKFHFRCHAARVHFKLRGPKEAPCAYLTSLDLYNKSSPFIVFRVFSTGASRRKGRVNSVINYHGYAKSETNQHGES